MKNPNKVSNDGSELFFPISSESLQGAETYLSEAFKVCFQAVPQRSKSGKLGVNLRLNTKKLLVDLSGLDASKISFSKAAVDCDLLRAAITDHAEELRHIAAVVISGEASRKELDKAVKLLDRLGLSEEATSRKGGGWFWIPIIVIAAILARSCSDNPEDAKLE